MEINALVVDDSGIMRKMVMRSLAESRLAQFTFTEAQDGADALTKFRDAAFDMLFVDWNMPNMSG
ncbi:MAG: response regulator, partial [Gemmatimonadetes bacterium]|nr:response regulator [Gemmatimonadota bacterium]